MKYTFKDPPKSPEHNSQRHILKFLFFPKILRNLDGKKELRWLEYAYINQIYQYEWINCCWTNSEEMIWCNRGKL